MKKDTMSYSEVSVYEGHYVPPFNVNEMRKKSRHPPEGEVLHPLPHLMDREDAYIEEATLPGAKGEDFLLTADDPSPQVVVLHKEESVS
jgi:hypothetical protein